MKWFVCVALSGLTGASALLWGQSLSAPSLKPAGSYLASTRTRAHISHSSSEVFHRVSDEAADFLKSQNVIIAEDPERKMIQADNGISIDTLLGVTRDVGADHLLVLTVDRPFSAWIKLTLQCFDTTGKLLWQEVVSSGAGNMSGKSGEKTALERLKRALAPRLGGVGLPLSTSTPAPTTTPATQM